MSTTRIPAADVIALVHKADISRLAYVRGKTVRHLCGGGYDTLERLANADLAEMEMKMDAYYRTLGKSLADYKAVIPLAWMVGGARNTPTSGHCMIIDSSSKGMTAMHRMHNNPRTNTGPETTGATIHWASEYDILTRVFGLGVNRPNSKMIVEMAKIKPGEYCSSMLAVAPET